jgi:hypothetical protein
VNHCDQTEAVQLQILLFLVISLEDIDNVRILFCKLVYQGTGINGHDTSVMVYDK